MQTREELTRNLMSQAVEVKKIKNDALQKEIKNDFFYAGAGNLAEGIAQFRKDFLERNFLCKGKPLAEYFPDKKQEDIRNEDIISKLAELFGGKDNAEHIVKAWSQNSSYLFRYLPSTGIDSRGILIGQPDKQIFNLTDEGGSIHLACEVDHYPIKTQFDAVIGYLAGPVKANIHLVQKDEQWGFQLAAISAENPLIHGMFEHNDWVSEKTLIERCHDKAVVMDSMRRAICEGRGDLISDLAEFGAENNIDFSKENFSKEVVVMLGELAKGAFEKEKAERVIDELFNAGYRGVMKDLVIHGHANLLKMSVLSLDEKLQLLFTALTPDVLNRDPERNALRILWQDADIRNYVDRNKNDFLTEEAKYPELGRQIRAPYERLDNFLAELQNHLFMAANEQSKSTESQKLMAICEQLADAQKIKQDGTYQEYVSKICNILDKYKKDKFIQKFLVEQGVTLHYKQGIEPAMTAFLERQQLKQEISQCQAFVDELRNQFPQVMGSQQGLRMFAENPGIRAEERSLHIIAVQFDGNKVTAKTVRETLSEFVRALTSFLDKALGVNEEAKMMPQAVKLREHLKLQQGEALTDSHLERVMQTSAPEKPLLRLKK